MRPSKADRDTSFAAFMDRAGPALLRTAWFLAGDADRAQELTQAALVKTYLAWPKIDHDRALPYARRCLVTHKTDVRQAARHEVADVPDARLEPGARSQSGSMSDPGSRSGSPSDDNDAVTATDPRDDLVRRLSLLPEQQRKIVVLRYYAGQSETSVADSLGISAGKVKDAASLGVAALREHANAGAQTSAQSQTQTPTRNVGSSPEGKFDERRPRG